MRREVAVSKQIRIRAKQHDEFDVDRFVQAILSLAADLADQHVDRQSSEQKEPPADSQDAA
jgi:hypothetical protein